MKLKFKAEWASFTSWYLLPTIRVGSYWFYFMWLKFDAGFHLEHEPIKAGGTD